MVDRDGTIVFVEVKTRKDENFGPTEAVVTAGKKTKLFKTARYFLSIHNIQERPLRVDVVVVVLGDKGPVRIRHSENVFVP